MRSASNYCQLSMRPLYLASTSAKFCCSLESSRSLPSTSVPQEHLPSTFITLCGQENFCHIPSTFHAAIIPCGNFYKLCCSLESFSSLPSTSVPQEHLPSTFINSVRPGELLSHPVTTGRPVKLHQLSMQSEDLPSSSRVVG